MGADGAPAAALSGEAPRPAASVLLLRDGPSGLEALLLERTSRAAFMPSLWVFPGGRVDAEDAEVAGVSDLADIGAAKVAAVRETLEEVDVWLGAADDGVRARAAVRGSMPWSSVPSLTDAALMPFARWVTPEGEGRRYDTWFFLARCPDAEVATPDGAEATRSGWFRPRDVLEAGPAVYPIAPPTFVHLLRLVSVATVADAWGLPCELAPIQPVRRMEEHGPVFSLPGCPHHAHGPRQTTPARVVWAQGRWRADWT